MLVEWNAMQRNSIELNFQFSRIRSGGCGPAFASLGFNWIWSNNREVHLHKWRLVHCVSLGRAVRTNSSRVVSTHNNTADRLTKRWSATRWRNTRRTWVPCGQQSAATLWWTTWSRQDFINGALLANRFFLFARRVDCQHRRALMPRRNARLKPHSVACTFHVDIPNSTGNDRSYWPWTNRSVQKKDGRRWFWVAVSLWLGFLGGTCTQVPVTRHMCCVRLRCLCVKRNVIVEDSNNMVSEQNPQRILYNALLAPGGAENASCSTHREPACPRANYRRCFFGSAWAVSRERTGLPRRGSDKTEIHVLLHASQQRLPSLLAMTDLRYLHGHCGWESTECALRMVLCVDG